MNVVKENIEVRIYPAKADKNDKGEKIVNISAVESNIGIYRFIYNKELEFINDFKRLLLHYGYDVDKIIVNKKNPVMLYLHMFTTGVFISGKSRIQ